MGMTGKESGNGGEENGNGGVETRAINPPFPLWEGARAKVSRAGRSRAYLSESGFSGFAGFSGFRFAQIAILAITGNPVKTNTGGRLPIKDEPVES